MKKIKKFTIQSVLIAFLLFIFYYFGGYYISKEECIRDSLRGLYAEETNIIMEIGNRKRSITLVTNPKTHSYSFIGTKKFGFLYHAGSSSTGYKIDTREKLDIKGFYEETMGSVIYIYRNDTSIEKIEVIMADGSTFILDEWHENFTGFHREYNQWRQNTYKAYDASNQLIYEKTY